MKVFNKIVHETRRFCKKYSSELFTAGSILGVAVTTGLAVEAGVKSGIKYSKHIVENDDDVLSGSDLTRDMFNYTWKNYIPTVISFAVTTGCILCGHANNKHIKDALTSGYLMAVGTLEGYRDKVRSEVGEDAEKEMYVDYITSRTNLEDIDIEHGANDVLFVDEFTGASFWVLPISISEAIRNVNAKFMDNGYATLADFFEYLMIKTPDALNDLPTEFGWTIEDGEAFYGYSSIDIYINKRTDNKGHEYYLISYMCSPHPMWEDLSEMQDFYRWLDNVGNMKTISDYQNDIAKNSIDMVEEVSRDEVTV